MFNCICGITCSLLSTFFSKMIHLTEKRALTTLLNQDSLMNSVAGYDEIRKFILISIYSDLPKVKVATSETFLNGF